MFAILARPAVPLLALAIGASTVLVVRGAEPSSCHPEAWAEAMARFEKEDAQQAPPKGGVVFVGSSSIRLWDLEPSFPDLQTINRGFGGSQICDSTHFAELLVIKHQPQVVVLYAGDNDIAAGKTPEQVHDDFQKFVAKIREGLPEARIAFISIKPSIARWKLADKIKEANRLIEADCDKKKGVFYVDVWNPMLGEDGKPREELLQGDKLHLSDEGYALWTKLVRPYIDPDEKATGGEGATSATTKEQ
jgi:lysophospholipase L1-like esterase